MEAIEILTVQKGMKAFKYSKELSQSANDHVVDCGNTGSLQPVGSDGSFPNERIARHCSFGSSWGESIVVSGTKAKEIVEMLVVSDGIPSRGNRKNVFSKDINFIGVSIGPHPEMGTMCVIDFAEKQGKVGELSDI